MDLTEFLYSTMVREGIKIHPDTINTLKEAISLDNIKFIDDKDGRCAGFLTWVIEGNAVIINNLVILKEKRGNVSLFFFRKFFRRRYPYHNYRWLNDKAVLRKQKPLEVLTGASDGFKQGSNDTRPFGTAENRCR